MKYKHNRLNHNDDIKVDVNFTIWTKMWMLFLTFLVLKLTHIIDWDWQWIFAPIWIPIVITLIVSLILAIVETFKNDE